MEAETHEGGELSAPSPLTKGIYALVRLCAYVSALLVTFAFIVLVVAIFRRYVMNQPILGVDEFVGYVLVTLVMLGTAEVLWRNDHVAIDLLKSLSGSKSQRVLSVWSDLAVLTFAIVVGWSTWKSVRFSYDFGAYTSGEIEIPAWITQVPVLVGSILLGLVCIARVFETLKLLRSK